MRDCLPPVTARVPKIDRNGDREGRLLWRESAPLPALWRCRSECASEPPRRFPPSMDSRHHPVRAHDALMYRGVILVTLGRLRKVYFFEGASGRRPTRCHSCLQPPPGRLACADEPTAGARLAQPPSARRRGWSSTSPVRASRVRVSEIDRRQVAEKAYCSPAEIAQLPPPFALSRPRATAYSIQMAIPSAPAETSSSSGKDGAIRRLLSRGSFR